MNIIDKYGEMLCGFCDKYGVCSKLNEYGFIIYPILLISLFIFGIILCFYNQTLGIICIIISVICIILYVICECKDKNNKVGDSTNV